MPTGSSVKKAKPNVVSKPKEIKALEARVTKLETQVAQLVAVLKRQKVSGKRFVEELRAHATEAYNFKMAVNRRK
jgi:predicted RNase H-like nuclease (RuvC/YqgF family)